MSTPCVAIIVPVYNIGKVLGRTIDSLLAQTYKNIVIIAVDDGSTDASPSILKKYAKKDARVQVYSKENGGVSSARNFGIEKAHTEKFITFVDGDDYVTPTYVADLVAISQDTGADIVCSRITAVKEFNGRTVGSNNENMLVEVINSNEATVELLYDGKIKNHVPGKLFSISCLVNERFDELISVGEDMEFVFRTLRESDRIALTGEIYYSYIKREGSAMNSSFTPKRATSLVAAQKIAATSQLSTQETQAAKVKLFTEAFSVGLLSYPHRREYGEVYENARKIAMKNRLSVIFDSNARRSQRIYAAATLIGFESAIKIASAKKKAKRRGV